MPSNGRYNPLLKRKKKSTGDDAFLADVLRMAALADEKKARDIVAYDVRGMTLIADALLVCTVTSEPQLKAVYHAIRDGMKEIGIAPYRSEGVFTSGWVLLDFSSVICHIFREQTRAFYDLDGMWGDAPQVALELSSTAGG